MALVRSLWMIGSYVPALCWAPRLKVKIIGTDPILAVDVIKDGKFVYHTEPGREEIEFEFVDQETGAGESYYYVRIQQRDRNLAWSSPIWVDYRK